MDCGERRGNCCSETAGREWGAGLAQHCGIGENPGLSPGGSGYALSLAVSGPFAVMWRMGWKRVEMGRKEAIAIGRQVGWIRFRGGNCSGKE